MEISVEQLLKDLKRGRSSLEAKRIVEPVPKEKLQDEINRLPDTQSFFSQGDITLYIASAQQIPEVMWEIGRLREVTFRAIGEGSGNAVDIDAYDQVYDQLFAWNAAKQEIVGAYRFGRLDDLQHRFGVNSIYTSSLFDFDPAFLDEINPALELGRSFVRAEYQGTSVLNFLWKGIGAFIVRNPQYQRLVGVVSIDRNYTDTSIHLMTHYLQTYHSKPELSKLLLPKLPWIPDSNLIGLEKADFNVIKSPQILSRMIQNIQPDGRGIPALIKHYLLLGADVLGFNVDPDFSDVVDAFIVVDLKNISERKLARFLGCSPRTPRKKLN